MDKYIFFYKDKDTDDRDCVKYIESVPSFSGVGLCGACFHTSFDYTDPIYDNVLTILTRKEFNKLYSFDREMSKLGYSTSISENPEKREQALKLIQGIQPIYDKLNSEGNRMLFEKVIEEEHEYLMYEFTLTEDILREIFSHYSRDYKDRGVITWIYDDLKECGYEFAHSCGYITKQNERYFDYEKLGYDLLQDDNFYQLSDGRVVSFNV